MSKQAKQVSNARTDATPRIAAAQPTGSSDVVTEEEIFTRLMNALFEHRLPPGTRLGEEQLAAIFGVSRARIRRVLPRLAHEGVVTLEPNRGAFVAKPTITETREAFEARRLIERGILEHIIAHHDRRVVVSRLRQHVVAERRAREKGDTRAMVRLSGEFHILLAEAAGNSHLAKIMRELSSLTCLAIALYDKPSVPLCLVHDHADIVDAIADGDLERATSLMASHLDHVEGGLDLSVVDSTPVDLAAALR